MADEFEDRSLTGFEKKLIEANSYSLIEGNVGFREAALATEKGLVDDWANTAPDQQEERERIWMKLQLLRDVLSVLDTQYINHIAGDLGDTIENVH